MLSRIISKCLWKRNLFVMFKNRRNHLSSLVKIQHRKFSSELNEIETELDGKEELDSTKLVDVKLTLYPNSSDVVINKLNQMSSLNEIFDFMKISLDGLNLQQTLQTLLIISDLVKLDPELLDEDKMEKLTEKLEFFVDQMTMEELTSCFLCLSKIHDREIRTPLMQKMADIFISQLKSKENVSPVSLARFSFAFNQKREIYQTLMAIEILPQLINQMENCTTIEDFNFLTIAMNNLNYLITSENFEKYQMKVREFMDKDLLNETKTACILRIVNFLNYQHWAHKSSRLVRDLISEIEDSIPMFETRHLMTINKSFQIHMESSRILRPMVTKAQELIQIEPSIELLSLAVLHVSPNRRTKIAEMVKKILLNYQISSSSSHEILVMVFKILRLLKISDLNLCDSYWTKVINDVYGTKINAISFKLTQCIHKYMFFNNNLGGTYRHVEFETCMIDMLRDEMKKPLSPKEFATYASFVIAYNTDEKISPKIVSKVEELHPQFRIRDTWQLSRGLQILQELRLKEFESKVLSDQIKHLNESLEKSAKIHLSYPDLNLSHINRVVRAHIFRKAPTDTRFFYEMMELYNKPLELNSRTIREISFNLNSISFRMDSVCDQFVDYILANWEHVTGDTVEKVLTCCYSYSYFPENFDFYERCNEIITRDFEYMTGLSIVQSLLALVFYKTCPQALITKVFSSEFIKRLEQEIEMCYSKNTYPQKVMTSVMQLNRAVCLDCPEVNIRWFQQSFVEAQISKLPAVQGKVQQEVKNLLLKIVKSPECVNVNHVTPYGYRVDFEVYTDNYNRFIKIPPEEHYHRVPAYNKTAILILNSKMFCDNDQNRLRGAELLRMRHLELLGYRVVHIKTTEFRQIYRTVSEKIGRLKSLLKIDSK